jgi:molybdopterin-biosynthesis enzyme MoeA-like protein
MAFGTIIIGDEILSGKRQDKHFAKAIEIFTKRALELAWCEYLGDDPNRITATLRRTFATEDVVLCFGGIGATPDDHTRQCAAAALGVPIERHPEASAIIEQRFGQDAYPHRILMAHFPKGAALVPNPYNGIAGFSVARHYFLPGFPEMAWPMMEWALDTHYAHLFNSAPPIELAIVTEGAGEGDLIAAMNAIVAAYPRLKLSSLPQIVKSDGKRFIELALKGESRLVEEAMARLKQTINAQGVRYRDRP